MTTPVPQIHNVQDNNVLYKNAVRPFKWSVPNQMEKRKMVERCKIDTPNTQIHDRSLSWLGTGTLLKMAGLN
jgi:hypothetical protein